MTMKQKTDNKLTSRHILLLALSFCCSKLSTCILNNLEYFKKISTTGDMNLKGKADTYEQA